MYDLIFPPRSNSESNRAEFCVVGLWDIRVAILRIPSLEIISYHSLGGEVIPRSILLVEFDGNIIAFLSFDLFTFIF